MATNCYVGKLNEDNTVDCIFIKYNGYYDGVGIDLLNDFNNQESIHDLIASGNGDTLYDKRKDEPYKMSFGEYDKIFKGTFDKPCEHKEECLAMTVAWTNAKLDSICKNLKGWE